MASLLSGLFRKANPLTEFSDHGSGSFVGIQALIKKSKSGEASSRLNPTKVRREPPRDVDYFH
jgi:hypothetical protein